MTLACSVLAAFYPCLMGKPRNKPPRAAASLFLRSRSCCRPRPASRQHRAGLGTCCRPVFAPCSTALRVSGFPSQFHTSLPFIALRRGDLFPSASPSARSSPSTKRCLHLPELPAGCANKIISTATNVPIFFGSPWGNSHSAYVPVSSQSNGRIRGEASSPL